MASTKLEELAVRTAARMYGVTPEEIQAVREDPEQRLLGFVGADWVALIMQIMQIVMEVLGDCQFGNRLLKAVRRPNIFASVVARVRANRVFRSGVPAFSNAGDMAVSALEKESAGMEDDDIAVVVQEVHNPNPYMLV